MANDLNKVLLTGRLGKDAEVRVIPNNGNVVATFSVASSRYVREGNSTDWKEQTEWFRVVAWEKLAERNGDNLKKGAHVFVEGRLQTREWTDNTGQKRYSTEVIASDIKFLDSRGRQDEGGYQSNGAPARSAAGNRNSNPFEEDDLEPEDIPF